MMPKPDVAESDGEATILGGTAGNFGGNVAGGADGGGEEILFLERVECKCGAGAGRKLATGQHSHCFSFSWFFSLLAVPLNPMLRLFLKMTA